MISKAELRKTPNAHNSSTFRLVRVTLIRLRLIEASKAFVGVIIGYCRCDDHLISRLPLCRAWLRRCRLHSNARSGGSPSRRRCRAQAPPPAHSHLTGRSTPRAQVLRIPLRHCKSPVAISTTESDLHAKGNPFSNRSDSHQTETALATFFLQSVTQGEQKAGHHEHAVYPCLPGKLSIG